MRREGWGALEAMTAPTQGPYDHVYVRNDGRGHHGDRPTWPELRLSHTLGAERLGRCRRTLPRGAAADPLHR